MNFMLENGLISVSIVVEDQELDFSLWDHHGETDDVRGFQTMLTKKDAKKLLRVLDKWVSTGAIDGPVTQ